MYYYVVTEYKQDAHCGVGEVNVLCVSKNLTHATDEYILAKERYLKENEGKVWNEHSTTLVKYGCTLADKNDENLTYYEIHKVKGV